MTAALLSSYLPMLPYHLSEAGRAADLQCLLFSFDWIRRQVERSNLAGALADYDLLPDANEAEDLKLSLLLGRDALASDPKQLAFQLHGRLAASTSKAISRLLEEACSANERTLWLRPVIPTLQRPRGSVQWVVRASSSAIDALVSTSDGGFACAAGGMIHLWDGDQERREEVLRLDEGSIRLLCPVAGELLLSAADDGRIHLWDPRKPGLLSTFSGHSSAVTALVSNGRAFVSAGKDGKFLGWKLGTSRPLQEFLGHEKAVSDVAFLDERRLASVAGDRTLRVWDLETGEQTLEATFPVFPGSAVARWKRQHLITGTFAGEVHIWKVEEEAVRLLRSFRYPAAGLNTLTLLGKDLGLSGLGNTQGVRPWDPGTGSVGPEIYIPGGEVTSCARLGAAAALCGTSGGLITQIAVPPISGPSGHLAERDLTQSLSPVFSVAVIDDGLVVSGSGKGVIRVWNPNTGINVRSLKYGEKLGSSLAVLKGGELLASTEVGGAHVHLWNPYSGESVKTFQVPGKTGGLCSISKDLLAVAPAARGLERSEKEGAKRICLWYLGDAFRPRLAVSLPELPLSVATMACLGGRFLIIGTYDNLILHLDLSTHKDRRNFTLSGHSRGVVALESLGGCLLASGSLDQTIRVWNLERRECVDVLEGHGGPVTGLVGLTPQFLASSSQDQTLRIWDLERRAVVCNVSCDAGLHCLAATPDRRFLVAGDARGSTHFFKIENLLGY